MDITFGSALNTNTATNTQGNEARAGVAVPAQSDNVSTTSFAPVTKADQSPKPQQEDAKQGVEPRQAIEQSRAASKQANKEIRREQNQEQEERQQADNRQQKDLQQSQVERQAAERREQDAREQRQLEAELQQIQKLADRDREVRAHEQAHMSVGGQHAGPMSFSYERGPDGQNYAVAGEVAIDTSKVSGNPQATLDKAETIRRAALAPAEPSSQDRRVASEAVLMTVEARADIQKMQQEEITASAEEDETKEAESSGEEERLDVEQKAQTKDQQEAVVDENVAGDVQELNERLSRIQSQIVEISQIDDKVNSKVNLLDVAT